MPNPNRLHQSVNPVGAFGKANQALRPTVVSSMVLLSAPLSHGVYSQAQFKHPEIVSFYNVYKGDLKIYLVENWGLINMWHPLRLKIPLRFCSPFQKPLEQFFEFSSMKS